MLLGSMNHISITVSNLPEAMRFLKPVLKFLGYFPEGKGDGAGGQMAMYLSARTGNAITVRQAKPEFVSTPHNRYAPGLHHLAFNAETKEQVDQLYELVKKLGGTILDRPDEYPYAIGGYYAVYFSAPDGMKFEFVYMPELEHHHRRLGVYGKDLWVPES